MTSEEIRAELNRLQPQTAWCHYFDFGQGIESVTKEQEPYFTKAQGLRKIGMQILESVPYITKKIDVKDEIKDEKIDVKKIAPIVKPNKEEPKVDVASKLSL